MKNTVTGKNVFSSLISRFHSMEERISELQDSSIEITKTETQREENLKKKKKVLKTSGKTLRSLTYA